MRPFDTVRQLMTSPGGPGRRIGFQSKKNRKHLEALRDHSDAEIRDVAAVLHQVALVHPRKRRRLKRLQEEYPDLWSQLAALGFAEEDSAWEDAGAWRAKRLLEQEARTLFR